MGVLLFSVIIISGEGDDDLAIDVDADFGADADAHSGDTQTNFATDGNWNVGQILSVFGIGKAPLIVILATDFSLLGVMGWMLNVTLYSIAGSYSSGFLAGVVLVLSLSASVLGGGLIAQPIGKILASWEENTRCERAMRTDKADRFVGCHGTVSSLTIPVENQGQIGQVDVIDSARNRVTINATLPTWAKVIPGHGTQVLVIDRQLHIYRVIVKDSTDEQEWLANLPRTKK